MKTLLTLCSLLIALGCLNAQTEKGASPLSPAHPLTLSPAVTRAVVVGISDYQDKDIPDLRFADRDAEAFANYLRSPAGGSLDGDHLKVLTNNQATAGRIAEALDGLLEQAKEGDQVIIYFSGHGDVERKTVSQPGFLLAWDAPSRVYMGGGTYSLAFLQEVVSTLSTQNLAKVTVITDACHAGKLAGSQIGGAQLTSANLAKQYANEVKILSCQPNEFSLEGEQWGGGRGCFSYHLVDGLFGLADRNGDGTVSVGEIDRYLEDKVTAEAAPQSQVPMLLGNKTERLAMVNAATLAALQKSKASGMPIFAATDSRGFEDEVLAKVDTSIRRMYRAFKLAVQEKRFLEPAGYCAEDFYTQLAQVEALTPLQGIMKRNYAAALQDDAQQALNKYIKADVHEISLSQKTKVDKYHDFPRQLARAADLLGEQHYLYRILQARRAYFEGFPLAYIGGANRATAEQALAHFRIALEWQPEMPNALLGMSWVFGGQLSQPDSAEFYAHKATAVAPTWVLPYVRMAQTYSNWYGQHDKAKQFLDLVNQIDSSNVLVWEAWATYYLDQKKYPEAERILKDIIASMESSVCMPCTQGQLSEIYIRTNRVAEAEALLIRLLENDSTNYSFHLYMGKVFAATGRYTEAEQEFRKVAILASYFSNPDDIFYYNMVNVYTAQHQIDKAFESLEKSLMAGNIDYDYMQQDPDLAPLWEQKERWKALMKKYFPFSSLGGQIKD